MVRLRRERKHFLVLATKLNLCDFGRLMGVIMFAFSKVASGSHVDRSALG